MKQRWGIMFLFVLVLAVVAVGLASEKRAAAQIVTGATTRTSVASSGAQGNSDSESPAISVDGRFVAFSSNASNLVLGDTNAMGDIFVHDRQNGTTTRVSVDSSGAQGDSESETPAISADGRFVAFSSGASNLVAGDTNDRSDIYVHDRQSGTTTRVSVDSSGAQGNGSSLYPALSADGRFVVFPSEATNLVISDTNQRNDFFVHDRQTGTTTRVSISSSGVEGNDTSWGIPSISADGRFVAFDSFASNLVLGDNNGRNDIFVRDRQTGTTTLVSAFSRSPSLSADSRFVAFDSDSGLVPGDMNSHYDVFVRDLQSGVTTLISVGLSGAQGNGESWEPSISSDGRFVAFYSSSSNLVSGDTSGVGDIFVHDRQTGTTTLVSVDSANTQGNSRSWEPILSADGRFVAFQSGASNLVPEDTNDMWDIFVREREVESTYTISGRLADQNGSAVSGVTICTQSEICGVSNADGLYNLDYLSVGTYSLSASKSGYIFTPASHSVTIPPDAVNQDYVALLLTYNISGRVTNATNGSPVAGTDVLLDENVTVQTDTNGNFTFNDVIPGEYNITVPGYTTIPSSRSISVPPDATDQDFAATPILSSVSGHVYHSVTSLPIAGATVSADGIATTVTDINGDYTITGLAPGTPIVAAAKPGMEFTPATRSVMLPPNATSIDFSGRIAGSIPETIERVSTGSNGAQPNQDVRFTDVSGDGRFVIFHSLATNLASNDTNGASDVFMHDRQTDQTIRISVSTDGTQSNGHSEWGRISADGRFVSFRSRANNLVPGDTNNAEDSFLRDLVTGQTIRTSTAINGEQANGPSDGSLISSDGRYILFRSNADNLVIGDDNDQWDYFLLDRVEVSLTLVSLAPPGIVPNGFIFADAMTDDANLIVFSSDATNLIEGDSNNLSDVFVYDRQDESVSRISIASDGTEAIGTEGSYGGFISSDGRYVSFESWTRNLVPGIPSTAQVNAFVHDRQTHETLLMSLASDGRPSNKSYDWAGGSMSADGRFITFMSQDDQLVYGDTNPGYDIFVRDRLHNTTTRVSVDEDGREAPGYGAFKISANGCYVAFDSYSETLVPGDTNGRVDVFVRPMLSLCDNDLDGVPEATEAAAPNNGDGNNDGVPDSQQANVTSLPNTGNGEYITLATTEGTELTGVAAIDNPAPGTEPPDAEFPVGFMAFGIGGLANGAATTVEIFLEGGVTAETYYKYGPTTDNLTDHWYEFLYDGTTGAEILPNKLVLHFVDGQRGDGDLTANGVIEDPGAPALVTPPVPPATYLSPTGTGKVGTGAAAKSFTGADILSYVKDTNTWDILYDGSYVKTPKNIDAFAFDGDDILISFAAGQAVAGQGTFAGQDIARFTPTSLGYLNTAGSFAWVFDGSDVGLTTSGENIDALWLDGDGRFYISTTGSGEVPSDSAVPAGAKFKFQDEDVLRFTPTALGATTSGRWELYWDTTAISGMGVEDIGGYWEDPATGDRTVSIVGAFNVGNVAYGGKFAGNGKTILRFAPNAAAPGGWAPAEKVTWLAAGATFPSNLDGIEMGR